MDVRRANACKLGKPAVAFASDVTGGGGVERIVGQADPRIDEHAATEQGRIRLRAEADDRSANVGSLDERETQGTGPTDVIDRNAFVDFASRLTRGSAVPPDPRVDVGVVHATRGDGDQDRTRSGLRNGDIVTDYQPLRSAVTGEECGAHLHQRVLVEIPG